MGQANSLPKQLEVFTKQHMNFLLQVKNQPNLLADSPRTRNALLRYVKFMQNKAVHGHGAYKDALLDEIWMWHLHRIHPVKYMTDCTAAYGYVIPLKSPPTLPPLPSPIPTFAPTVDLINCVGKHREFISKVEPLFASNDEQIQFLANQYLKFLKLVPHKEPGKILIPTIGIDLIWHTHMMVPESYSKDTKEIAGNVLDHEHTTSETDFEANLAYLDLISQNTTKNLTYRIKPILRGKHQHMAWPTATTTAATETVLAATASPSPDAQQTNSYTTTPSSETQTQTQTQAQPTQTTNTTTTEQQPQQQQQQQQQTPEPQQTQELVSPPTPSDYSNPPTPAPTADEVLMGVKNEVTWDQDSGTSLWLGGGWGNEIDPGTSGGGSGHDSGNSGSGNGAE